jgi:hypothetical protein
MNWRPVESSEELTRFAAGKTIQRFDCSELGAETIFTDGTAMRCSAQAGTRYSSLSEDGPTVVWEVLA